MKQLFQLQLYYYNMATRKRRRRNVDLGGQKTAARPIDKDLICFDLITSGVTQVQTLLYTSSYPATLTGLRWSMSFHQTAGTSIASIHWVMVILPDGVTAASTLATANTNSLYQPEQHVLAFGVATMDNNVQSKEFNGTTKTMRRLKVGDRLLFLMKSLDVEFVGAKGVVQFFTKV